MMISYVKGYQGTPCTVEISFDSLNFQYLCTGMGCKIFPVLDLSWFDWAGQALRPKFSERISGDLFPTIRARNFQCFYHLHHCQYYFKGVKITHPLITICKKVFLCLILTCLFKMTEHYFALDFCTA